MKPARFELHEPVSIAAAVALLAEHGDDAKVLAGGQSLTPMLALRLTRFDHLVDLGRIDDLLGIRIDRDVVRIGAMTPQAMVERDPRIAALVPLLARAVPRIGHRAVRNRGTIGGSLAHADPASELPAVALALDATFTAIGPAGTRTIAARDFFLGTWTTALADDEVLTEITFPVAGSSQGFAIEEVARRHGDFALAGATIVITVQDGVITHAAIALFGMAPSAVRAPNAEALLVGASIDTIDHDGIGRAAAADTSPTDDIHATAEYRLAVGAHLVGRAIASALEDARA
jgi:Aerobic-type carbon monoxide dehydrogenase, middle subunit CoxM/CutM homologs